MLIFVLELYLIQLLTLNIIYNLATCYYLYMIKAESTKNNEREAWVQLGLLDFTTLKGGQSLYHFLNNQLLATSKR